MTEQANGASINYFMSKFNGEFSRPNRYLVNFIPPKGLKFDAGLQFLQTSSKNEYEWFNAEALETNKTKDVFTAANNELVRVSCSSMTMPGKTVSQNYHYQSNIKFPTAFTTDIVSFSFYADKQLTARKYFETWLDMVVNRNNTLNFYEEYTSNVFLQQLDRTKNEKVYEVKLLEAYPVSVAPVEYSMSSDNSIVQIMVSMIYKNWLSAT